MLSFTLKKGRNDITAGASRTQKAAYYALYYLLKAVGLLPAWFLYYPLAGVCYLLLYYLFRYRLQVTRENLQNAFPEKSREELRRIERRFYRHLAEVFIDTIDLTSISRRQLRRRMMIKDEAVHRKEVEGKDWIAGMSHYGSWEYFIAYALGDGEGRETSGVYKTLHNRVMDMLYRSIRSRMGMEPVPMSVILRHVVRDRQQGIRMGIGLIADQAPPWFHRDYWYDFLGQPTSFYDGLEKMALRFGMPVYFVHIDKIRRAHYTARFELIYDGQERVAPHEITKRYAAKLEAMIRQRPELWLWSHRRWKHKPTPEELEKQREEECPR